MVPTIAKDKPLFVNTWGLEFWKCYSARKDILETSGSSSNVEQIAWIASTAADVISRREKEGLLFTGPFLLFLVPSKKKSSQGLYDPLYPFFSYMVLCWFL